MKQFVREDPGKYVMAREFLEEIHRIFDAKTLVEQDQPALDASFEGATREWRPTDPFVVTILRICFEYLFRSRPRCVRFESYLSNLLFKLGVSPMLAFRGRHIQGKRQFAILFQMRDYMDDLVPVEKDNIQRLVQRRESDRLTSGGKFDTSKNEFIRHRKNPLE